MDADFFDGIDFAAFFAGTVRGEGAEVDYTIHPDLHHIIDELDRLEAGPSFDVISAFEAAIHAQFERTRADMHVRTGSLYLSGRVFTHHSPGLFVGTIAFGGPSAGIIPDVTYARPELARGRTDGTVDPELHHGPTLNRVPVHGELRHQDHDTSRLADRRNARGRPDTHFFFAAVDDEGFGEAAYVEAIRTYLRGH